MNTTAPDKYRSGDYYRESYLSNAMDLPTATRWMNNYLNAVRGVFPSLDSYRQRRVLEIGSSYGGFVNLLNRQGFRDVTAADLNALLFSKELPNRLLILDLLAPPPPGELYDLIFAFDVLEHIADSPKVAQNIRQMLGAGRVFVFSVPYPHRKHLLDNDHINMQYPCYYTNLFRRQGFRLLGMQTVSFVPYIWRLGMPASLHRVVNNKAFITEVFFAFQKLDDAAIN